VKRLLLTAMLIVSIVGLGTITSGRVPSAQAAPAAKVAVYQSLTYSPDQASFGAKGSAFPPEDHVQVWWFTADDSGVTAPLGSPTWTQVSSNGRWDTTYDQVYGGQTLACSGRTLSVFVVAQYYNDSYVYEGWAQSRNVAERC
jgi:hypothetical protein